jgi:hypothetical protein
MDLPHADLLAPLPVLEAVSGVARTATVLAVFGRAKDLGELRQMQRLQYLWISEVNAASASVVADLHGLQRLVIHDLRIQDLSLFAKLSALLDFSIASSPRLKSLSGVDRLVRLQRLIFFDNCNYTSLEPLVHLQDLETLCLEGGWSKPLRLDTLAPLSRLSRLKRLRLASLRVADGSLRPPHQLGELSDVFIAKAFTDAEFRDLAIALPNARGQFVDSFRDAS